MNKKKENELCEVLDLAKIKKKCKEVIEYCDICEGVIIDNDKVPEQYIVDYNDRQIYSAKMICVKCGAKVCDNCHINIDNEWEQIVVCNNCYDKYKKKIDRIFKLQKKVDALATEVFDEIEEFLNDE